MKIFYKYIWLLCLLPMAFACKRVEKNDEFLHSIYSVIKESNLYKNDGSFIFYQYTPNGNPRVAGDTLTIAGVLGGSKAGRQVQIGDSTVQTFGYAQYRIFNTSTGDTVWTDVDYLKCRIPRGVTGNTVAVTVTVNGVPLNAPSLKIQQFTDIPSAMDTTLIVEKVAEWLPADLPLYNTGTQYTPPAPLWTDGTVTNNGNIWFYNMREGIFRISNGVTQSMLHNGSTITPITGSAFKIVNILGFTVDIDETMLYFSASTTEQSADTTQYYITRLCRMNPFSGGVEVLNRSTFMRPAASYPRAADLSTPLYDPAYNYLPAEGNTKDVKIVLKNMHLMPDGTLFATNHAYNTIITPKHPLAGNPKFPQFSDPLYYAQRDSVGAQTWYARGDIGGGLNNFVRIRNGEVKSLAKPNTNTPVPAQAIFFYHNQQISPDGKYIYAVSASQKVLTITSTDDFENETIGMPGTGDFSFSSIDTSSLTGWHQPTMPLDEERFITGYILSNRNGVFFPAQYGYQGISLLGINFSQHNAYAYAGTEAGLKIPNANAATLGQTNATGLAKWVNFSPGKKPKTAGTIFFIGFDRRNNLYFGSYHYSNVFGQVYQYQSNLPMEIFRIRKP